MERIFSGIPTRWMTSRYQHTRVLHVSLESVVKMGRSRYSRIFHLTGKGVTKYRDHAMFEDLFYLHLLVEGSLKIKLLYADSKAIRIVLEEAESMYTLKS